jgi:hypothetical protein
MFEEGNIIYFTPFYFKNGNAAKSKYFIVLKINKTNSIIASLPTRKDSIPNNLATESGCVEQPEINLNCFIISKNQTVTECGRQFDFQTYIYGHQIDDYQVDLMKDIYKNEGVDYIVWGKMKPDLFRDLINCFKKSDSVKVKYKKLL